MNLSALLQKLKPLPKRIDLGGMVPSAAAYIISHLCRRETRLFCVVAATQADADRFAADLVFFLPALAGRIVGYPANDSRPYQPMRASSDVVAQRLRALFEALAFRPGQPLVIVAPVAAIARTTMPTGLFREFCTTVKYADELNRDGFAKKLTEAGYVSSPLVEDIGTMAMRGAIIDLWAPTHDEPVRIELEGDMIASIRYFDPETQRSHGNMDSITFGPAEEILITDATKGRALDELRRRADDAGLPASDRRPVTEAISSGRRLPVIDTLLPLFYEKTVTIADYLTPGTVIVSTDGVSIEFEHERLMNSLAKLHAQSEGLESTILPEELYGSPASILGDAPVAPLVADIESVSQLRSTLPPAEKEQDPLTPLAGFLRNAQSQKFKTIIACHTELAAERTVDLFRWHGLSIRDQVSIGPLSSGFRWADEALLVLTEEELFGAKIARRAPKRPSAPAAFLSFQDLEPGGCLVHEQHGIGRFLGLKHLEIAVNYQAHSAGEGGMTRLPASSILCGGPATQCGGGGLVAGAPVKITNDFVVLEYLGGDKLYLPVYRLNLLQRYIGAGDGTPILDRLGGARWGRATKRALQSIRLMANDLLKIYAQRQTHAGTAFAGRDHELEEFEAAFPYDETPDQWQAIEDVLRDMQDEKPMDRLICGDVGYGKTEVAMRAAFRAAMDGKQVAVLVPTTLLAFQHYQTFTQRFTTTAVRIEMLSRFKSRAEQKEIVDSLAKGTVDIVIGTHRLLQKDVTIPRLGLLVIDEEQRFGVAHKERLRKLRATVDTLVLSATPIPRTLHMALGGLRDISVIQTPPADRQAIRTYIVPFSDRLIREAIGRELHRSGEVFFVHNRVETIYGMRDHIRRLVPDARVVVAHGQMDEGELEDAMFKFVGKEADVLLCTSIIESGLDIPSANTILINRADTFGLAQLYQIRGRVGRSSVQAQAYLLTPPEETLPTIAQKRLNTIARYTELGSGFSIAMHDLELRGAGNLLGAQQSGHITEIGYEMFTRLLEQTIRKMRGEPEDVEIDPEITLPLPAYLPEDYVTDPNTRIVWYKRLSGLETQQEIDDAASELHDRFGPIPQATTNLLRVIEIRQAAKAAGIDQVRYDNGVFAFRFHASAQIDPAKLMAQIARNKTTHSLRPNGTLAIRQAVETANVPSAVLQLLGTFHMLDNDCRAYKR